jgi:hypothetical protein
MITIIINIIMIIIIITIIIIIIFVEPSLSVRIAWTIATLLKDSCYTFVTL